jgi:hypothetical protein
VGGRVIPSSLWKRNTTPGLSLLRQWPQGPLLFSLHQPVQLFSLPDSGVEATDLFPSNLNSVGLDYHFDTVDAAG